MKFEVDQKTFAKALREVGAAISSRPTHPILAAVKIEANSDKGELTITGFNLSLGIIKVIGADVLKAGSVAVPHNVLSDIISRLPAGVVSVDLGDQLNIKGEKGKFKVGLLDCDEYPDVEMPESDSFGLPAQVLAKGLKAVNYACSTDETKQILTGINFTTDGKSLSLAATNGHQLATYSTSVDGVATEPITCTIPLFGMATLSTAIASADTDKVVSIKISDTLAQFEYDETIIVTRILDGSYPQYKQLLPNKFGWTFDVSKADLQSAVHRVSLFSDKNYMMKFLVKKGDLTMHVQDQVGEATDTVECSADFELELGFNHKYITNALKTMAGDVVTFNGTGNNTPVVFSSDKEALGLIMPVTSTK